MRTRRRATSGLRQICVVLAVLATTIVASSTRASAASTPDPIYFGGLALGPIADAPTSVASAMNAVLADQPADETFSKPVTISGMFKLDTGSVLTNKMVYVSLDPGPALLDSEAAGTGDAIGVPLGHGVTDSGGRFVIVIPGLKVGGIAPWLQADGGVDLLFTSFGTGFGLLYRLEVDLPATTGDAARAVVEDDSVLDPAQVKATASLVSQGAALPGIGAGIPVTNIILTASSDNARNGTATSDLDANGLDHLASWSPQQRCAELHTSDSYLYKWVHGNAIYRGWVPVQRLDSASRTYETYQWSNNKQTTVQAGLDLSYEGVTATSGYTHSTEVSAGVTLGSYGHNFVRQVMLDFEFRYYYLKCWDNGGYIDAGVRELRPYNWTGGSRLDTLYPFTCNSTYRISVAPISSTWVGMAGSYSRVQSVSVQGFSLSSSSTNGSTWRLFFNNVTSHSAYLCGENADPSQTPRTMEVDS